MQQIPKSPILLFWAAFWTGWKKKVVIIISVEIASTLFYFHGIPVYV